MLVLIDESGCAGFKLSKGSSPYFVVAMVIFDSYEEAEKTSRAIEDLREKLGVKPEFKFSNLCDDYKARFFDEVCKFQFRVRGLVVDKAKIYSAHLRTDINSFYNYFVKMLLKHDQDSLHQASIKIDGSGDKVFRRELQAYLRKELAKDKVRKFRFVDSKNDSLIQLADMVVGAIARSYRTDKIDAYCWRRKLANKIDDIWDFGF